MKEKKILNIKGTVLENIQLENYLQKIASDHTLSNKSDIGTYPIPRVKDNFAIITETYRLLNEHIKLEIPIHPAGEWILDNYYAIEETVKSIISDLTKSKYKSFLGIANGSNKGFARIYVLASEIIAYTDGNINGKMLKNLLAAYQSKKNLAMEEIWNIGLFLQISLIEKIRDICEKIFASQLQKYRVENIVERLVENKSGENFKYQRISQYKNNIRQYNGVKYPFMEYMSYKLRRYGKKAYEFLSILDEQADKMGTDMSDIIKKEHFDIAVKKVSMGNCITSIKELRRINFQEIFEEINGVEEILKKDPAQVYDKMDYKSKEYYRGIIKNISKKTKTSEIYIANIILALAEKEYQKLQELNEIKNKKETNIRKILEKKSHIGYYLLQEKYKDDNDKARNYIFCIWGVAVILSIFVATTLKINVNSLAMLNAIKILVAILLVIPMQEVSTKIFQYILSKIVKPKLIPKIDFSEGIDKENATFVVIPTIVKSREKVKELFKNLEVFYIANKSQNLYFALLGDCSSGKNEFESFDEEVIEEGKLQVERLNNKYKDETFPKFNFIYRKRVWNDGESCYLGWERKRGMLNQFNEYILGNLQNPFRENTIEKVKNNIPNIKYVITLDADTDLVLQSGLELIGAMAHILNMPIIDARENRVVDGYGIMQPRVGINMDISMKNLFTQIYAGAGGVDSYTNAISDFYQDNFGEGIFTGKGIYDLKVFSKVLKDRFPENLVLSHDLLEGNYLRCGLASDIMLMDGYPTSYNSFKTRQHRWTRGDFQIVSWLKKNKALNLLSRYKIFDNLIRAVLPIMLLLNIVALFVLNKFYQTKICTGLTVILVITAIPTILNLLNRVIYKKENERKQKTFSRKIGMLKAAIIRGALEIGVFPDKAYMSFDAICKTMYRLAKKKHLLEWTTAEEAEKTAKNNLESYYLNMKTNIVLSVVLFVFSNSMYLKVLAFWWLITPLVVWYISRPLKKIKQIERLPKEDKDYIYDIGRKTWTYFKDYLNEKNNYLPPDNYQENRKEKVVNRTSSTNIGLALLAVVSSYDLKYENFDNTINLLEKMIMTIEGLQKWNGHLYNWYNIQTLEPLKPQYVSSVDSGNFVGYLYTINTFLKDVGADNDRIKILQQIVERMIQNTDFTKLFDYEKRLFSIGYNIEENKLTDSYYDLLATEARQASLVAIAKKDIKPKHWFNLSRTLTVLNKYRGLISWSGTAFEYLMPNVNIKKYEGGLLDESCKFMIMSQKQYANKIGIPWGFSEAAFNLKDLNNNYQYKAFGIPWLGLKRGLADEFVIAAYGSFLAINEDSKEVVNNLRILDKQGMNAKYGFYESIDYTPSRLKKGEKRAIVKTYMAHHQGLILLSINNLFNDNILQKRFMENPEICSIDILLQESIPENYIITKKQKEKPEKIVYMDCDNYSQREFLKADNNLNTINVISNENYSIITDTKGHGYSKYKDIQINRFKETSDEEQGIFFYIKNIKSKRIWNTSIMNYLSLPDKYKITFAPEKTEIYRVDGNIETTNTIGVSSNNEVEIRRVNLRNTGATEEILEISSFIEPVLSTMGQDYAHPTFNNLFLTFEKDDELDTIIIKRKKRNKDEKEIYMAIRLYTEDEMIGEFEFEIDKEKFTGRGNLNLPSAIENSKPFSKNLGFVVDPIVSFKSTINIKPEQEVNFSLLIAVGEDKQRVMENIRQYSNEEKIKRSFKLSRVKSEAEIRYLGLKGREVELYQKMLGYIVFSSSLRIIYLDKLEKKTYPKKDLWRFGISGDLPIVLVKIKEVSDIYVVREILKAYEYFRVKNVYVDLVIVNEEKCKYESYVKEAIYNSILNKNLGYLINQKSGIFIIENEADISSMEFRASLIFDCKNGKLETQLQDMEEEYISLSAKNIADESKKQYISEENSQTNELLSENLKYYNEYGGFTDDGKEYKVIVNKNSKTPTVWSHIIGNENFGTLVTESMGGFTWSQNSRLNKLTVWQNNQVLDTPSEVIYVEDEATGEKWSLGANPMPDNNNYYATFGFGYANYTHRSSKIEEKLTVFVPNKESTKINLLSLKNLEAKKKKIKLVYYIKPVLGEEEMQSNGFIEIKMNRNSNMVYAKNLVADEFNDYIYVSSSEKINSYTGNREFFLGKGGVQNPDGLKKLSLNEENGLGQAGQIIAVEIKIELEAYESKDISLILGANENLLECKDIAYKYFRIENCKKELTKVEKYWNDLINTVQVDTPIESMNIMLNGWLTYQTICCRLWARSAFYQSGGAYGFRDQLQDTIGMKYIDADFMKKQIIKHSSRQFEEGDVQHWWHEETNKGIRTRFSDDLLWLPYLVIEYINFTGDKSILEEKTSYLKGEMLANGVDERYDVYEKTDYKESIYNHCIRAIDRALDFGENGLPKIGSGDWNDGFSEVGNKGKGESVWLGFFLYKILKGFIALSEEEKQIDIQQGKEERSEVQAEGNEVKNGITYRYTTVINDLKKALNNNGWDGRWYKRAYTDDGKILGSINNEECKIDSISQSWAVISDAGDNDKKFISMESLENHLVDLENGIIKLLDPPFEKGELEPGYIKAYLPGVRENGGQYTHAAIWVIIAETMLGFGDKAGEYFRMINPIEHTRTKEAAQKYKVEPYVVSADIYGRGNLTGRGGWTWYTGSSSWMYDCGIEYILGLKVEKGILRINPCIPSNWKEYSIQYKYKGSIYNIKVKNRKGKNTGIEKFVVNGKEILTKEIALQENGGAYEIEVEM